MREIKFRAMGELKTMFHVTEIDFEKGTWSGKWVKGHGAWAFNQPFKEHPIMQYTGLKDKTGKEIYEGDIVTYQPNEHVGLHKVAVSWLDNSACFWPLGAEEVIGNIYENPELLTEP